jgi:hypothetical protein
VVSLTSNWSTKTHENVLDLFYCFSSHSAPTRRLVKNYKEIRIKSETIARRYHKGTVSRDVWPLVFHHTTSPRPLVHRLKRF